jgi:hypothetical protein
MRSRERFVGSGLAIGFRDGLRRCLANARRDQDGLRFGRPVRRWEMSNAELAGAMAKEAGWSIAVAGGCGEDVLAVEVLGRD